jgi:preprotein translocase subunit SecE
MNYEREIVSMPRNWKEELMFTGMMAGLMVIVMEGYNIALNAGMHSGYISEVLLGYPLALVVAILCDLIIVGPIVKMLFFKFIFKPEWEAKPIKIALSISTMMVLGMVSLMSLFGIIVTFGLANISGAMYVHAWLFNVIVALPLQLIIVGPICRALLSKIQK